MGTADDLSMGKRRSAIREPRFMTADDCNVALHASSRWGLTGRVDYLLPASPRRPRLGTRVPVSFLSRSFIIGCAIICDHGDCSVK